ncbi:ABC transporter ATP-binding protein [Aquamicrobium sp. LC103]|uniref:ABC transporter ATP-binding protein n=1 Tax=Aquamicrobium sp. LC103 TaxID=1120658 RepID=UPI00063EA982|nr:ABC transporter ATP-binding protein [Aquamicrobium sp. LC103]TKT75266.1 ABC transporter ATP-binding protein [Aquamicrobium sp. LC103]
MTTIIDVQEVTKRFGNVLAVDRCSLKVEKGTITGLIGPNGAGKTTMFNMVAGAFPPTSGRILLDGEDVTGLPAHELFSRGLLRTFQIAQEFSTMTALENLMMVPARQSGENVFNACFRRGKVMAEEARTRRRAEEVIDLLRLSHVKNELAGNLSGGQKKLLELGRVMMTEPRVVLLDEIAAGVNRTLLNDLAAVVQRLNKEEGLTFFVIEHDMDLIARLCDPVIVMAAGSVMVQGPMEEIRNNPEVVEAYFGGGPALGGAHGEAH